jgi:hypothetical protein
LISQCNSADGPLRLLSYKSLPDFPSASAIEYAQGKIFLFGDDAPYLLVLNPDYTIADTVRYLEDSVYRLPKSAKPDIEAAALLSQNNQSYLCGVGSFSTDARRQVFLFPLSDLHSFQKGNAAGLYAILQSLPEVNIEGMASMPSGLVLANRANKTHTMNQLLLLNALPSAMDSGPARRINFDLQLKTVAGVSGLFYLAQKDLLLFTASEEDTPSATQDGAIGNSYIGYIKSFSKQTDRKTVVPDAIVNLSGIHSRFRKQKIESLCVEQWKDNELVVDLAADNDNGQSGLFKIKWKL